MGNLSSTSKSYWRVSKTINLFLSFQRATGLLRGNQWAWILPSFFCALRTKKYDRFIFFFLFKGHISLFLAKYIFLCSWCHTQMQPSNGHQADRSFFSFSISNGSQVWVMNTIKISLILVRLVQLFSITFFIQNINSKTIKIWNTAKPCDQGF